MNDDIVSNEPDHEPRRHYPPSVWDPPSVFEQPPYAGAPTEPGWLQASPADVESAARRPARGRRALLAGGIAALTVLAAGVGAGVDELASGSTSSPPAAVTAQSSSAPAVATSNSVHSALAVISPSVVLITTTIGGGGSSDFGGGFGREGSGAGTGIVLTSAGQLLTNAHVVAGATSIKVAVPGHETMSATVVGADTTQDLAVLQLDGASGLTPATFAATKTVHVGDGVLAIGNAEGYGGAPSVTQGIVSALNRTLPGTDNGGGSLTGLLQTDAAINPGNSGGPLVDTAGRVIGIDTAVATGSRTEPAQGIGFAIPADTVLQALPALRAGGSTGSGGRTTTGGGYLGVEIQDAPNGGALIGGVAPGSPAERAGLAPGDVITGVDGNAVSGASDLSATLGNHHAGDSVRITYRRSDVTHTATVRLAARPATTG